MQPVDATVIVAVDGSDAALQAARAGLAILHPEVDVLIVTVVEYSDAALPVSGFAGGVVSPQEVEAEDRARTAAGSEDLDAAVEALRSYGGRPVMLRGSAGPALCDLAADRSARAIVMGSRGRGGIARAVLGSVADFVVRNAPCPVVVTRHS